MKCIRHSKTGLVKRVSNELADRWVTKGEATYCGKEEWKKLRKK